MGNVVKNTILVGISEISSKGIIALAMIILVRTLSPESYGIYSLAITLTYLFIGFIHSGFYTIGMREIAKYPELSNKYVNNVTTLKIIISIISFGILSIIVFFLDKPIEAKIAFLLAGVFLFLLAFHIDWLFRGQDIMEIPSIGSILQGISLLIFIFLFVKEKNDFKVAVVTYLVSWFIYIFFEQLVYTRKYGLLKFELDKGFCKTLVKASFPISISALIITLYGNNNILILNYFKGDYETGIYSAMVRLMNLLLLPNSVLQIAFFPELSRSVLDGTLKLSQRRYLVVLFSIGFFAIFGMFGYSKEIIGFFFGKNYLAGDNVFKISLIACFFSYLSASSAIIAVALDKQKTLLLSTISGVIVSISLNLLLVPKFGAIGAVVTLSITEIIVFLVLLILNWNKSFFEPYLELTKPFLIGILSLGVSKTIGNITSTLFGISSYVILFLLFAFATKLITFDILKKLINIRNNSQ